jgi:hypothetical protein
MVLSELIAELHKLDRADKFRVVQILVSDLATEDISPPRLEGIYPIYTPLGNEAAAEVLLEMLQAAEAEGRSATRD